MDVRVEAKVARPGVEDARDAELGAEPTRIAPELEERLGRREEQVEELLAIGHHEATELGGQREDDVKRMRGEHAFHPSRDPARLRQGPALRAVTVAARVVGDGLMPARKAHVDVSAQRRGPATRDGAQDGVLIGREGVRAHEGLPVEADDVRDLECGPVVRAPPQTAGARARAARVSRSSSASG